ncbi:MAG: hypothetical protein KBF99_05910 [Leptospiraceae bacterium]|jgi:hypothetical protein|nr:hypothetical protein [Leptospiraceae bacterium]
MSRRVFRQDLQDSQDFVKLYLLNKGRPPLNPLRELRVLRGKPFPSLFSVSQCLGGNSNDFFSKKTKTK